MAELMTKIEAESDGSVSVHIPKDRQILDDNEVFLVACAMLYNSEDEYAQEIRGVILRAMHEMAVGVVFADLMSLSCGEMSLDLD